MVLLKKLLTSMEKVSLLARLSFVFMFTFCLSTYAGPSGIAFYRSTDSPFASGLSSKASLLKSVIETYSERWYKVEERLWTPESNILSWQDFAQKLICPEKTALYLGRDTSSEPESFCSANELLEVLEHQNTRFRIRRANRQVRWVDDEQITMAKDNLGYAYNPSIVSLESLEGPARLRLAPYMKLKILNYRNNLVEVEWNSQKFKCPRSLLITPLDMAEQIAFRSGKWIQIEKITSNQIFINKKNYQIPNKPILKLSNNKVVVKSSAYFYEKADYRSKQRSHYSGNILLKQQSRDILWVRSQLKPHGEVFWIDQETFPRSQRSLSDLEFFDRTIFDMAASPLNSKVIFASAKGIYKKALPNEWKKIDLFGEDDHPIVFAKSGRLIIGTYYSDDEGLSFKPYVHWHSVLERLGENGKSIDLLKIKKIDPLDRRGDQIKLLFESQSAEHEIRWNINDGSWKLVR